jgi:ribosomal protein S12 methylthiotransferase accessory factor
VHVELQPWPRRGAATWLDDCDLCIVAADQVSPQRVLELNARCLAARIPLLPGLAMGEVGQVGPLVRGGMGACVRCVDLRLRVATGRPCLAPYGPPHPRTAAILGGALAARAAELDELETTRVLSYHWANGSVTRHPILRTWRCPDCSHLEPQPAFRRPARMAFGDRPASDARHILAVRNQLVDPVTGPITELQVYDAAPGDPPVHHAVAALADEGWARSGHPLLHCGGNGLDEEAALAAALGEAVERACAVLPRASDVVVASYRDVQADAVDPLKWDLFHPSTRAQPGFPYARPTRSGRISWTWGWSLTEQRPMLVPASRVFVPFESRRPGDYVDYPLLSGFATGNTLEEATLRALLEVIERDSFMIAWANRLPLRRVRLDPDAPGGVGAYTRAFDQRGLEVRCGLVELDLGAPVAIAMVRSDRPGDAAVVVSAAADLDPAQACRRALNELTANRLNVRHSIAEAGGAFPSPDPSQVTDETAHALLYARPDMVGELARWWDPREEVSLPEEPRTASTWANLSALVETISGHGLDVLAVDLTPPEIRALDLWNVKALVPGAYPMNFDSRWPHLGGVRIVEAPVHAGLLDRPLRFDELNRVPHPFP